MGIPLQYFEQRGEADIRLNLYIPRNPDVCTILESVEKKAQEEFTFAEMGRVHARDIKKLERIIDLETEGKQWERHFYIFLRKLDFSQIGAAYWKDVFKQLQGCIFLEPFHYRSWRKTASYLDMVKAIKQERFVYRRDKARDDFFEQSYQTRYGVKIGDWLDNTISLTIADLSCVDNIRVARIKCSRDMKYYRYQRRRGCCGFIDQKNRCPIDKQEYLIGCNYGH